MLRHLVFIQNPNLLQRVRELLSDTYGSSVSRFVTSLEEIPGIVAIHAGEVKFMIADIPAGTTTKRHLKDLWKCVPESTHVVLIYSALDSFSLTDDRACTFVPSSAVQHYLVNALRQKP